MKVCLLEGKIVVAVILKTQNEDYDEEHFNPTVATSQEDQKKWQHHEEMKVDTQVPQMIEALVKVFRIIENRPFEINSPIARYPNSSGRTAKLLATLAYKFAGKIPNFQLKVTPMSKNKESTKT